jgi:crotonobetainyl-CoA:carnitine CoA-transferase CaiB-like acyl-CoA transferase
MFEAMAAFNLNEHLSGATWGDAESRGYQRAVAPDRRPYRTKDGWLGVLPYTPTHWTKVMQEIGHPEILENAWFRDPTERSKNFDKLYATMAEVLQKRTTAEWLEVFSRLDVPHAPVRSPTDLLNDPHLAAVGFFKPNFATETPMVRTLRQAVGFADLKCSTDIPPPALGADTEAVLREAGCTEAEIKAARTG